MMADILLVVVDILLVVASGLATVVFLLCAALGVAAYRGLKDMFR